MSEVTVTLVNMSVVKSTLLRPVRLFVMRAARLELQCAHAATSCPTHNSGLGASARGGTWSAVVAGRSRHQTQTGPDARRRARAFWYAFPRPFAGMALRSLSRSNLGAVGGERELFGRTGPLWGETRA